MTEFLNDENLGKQAVKIYTDYLEANNIPYAMATTESEYMGIDIFVNSIPHEVKHQSYDNAIVIEESDGLRQGWIYTSTSDYLIEVYLSTSSIIMIDMAQLRAFYGKIKKNYILLNNDCTNGKRGDIWQGTFRVLPVAHMTGYVDVVRLT